MNDQFAFEIVVHKGKNLPKADYIGKIDAYVVIQGSSTQPLGLTTKTISVCFILFSFVLF